jgi:PKD repeat protein
MPIMNKKLIYLLMFVFTLGLSFTACGDDDDDDVFDLVLASGTATVKVGEEISVKITKGNGGYTVTSADPAKATAVYDETKGVVITGVAVTEGTVKVTVKDKANKSAEIAVTVTAADTPAEDYALEAAGTYNGDLAIAIPGSDPINMTTDIVITRDATNKVTLLLNDFKLDPDADAMTIEIEGIDLTEGEDGEIKLTDKAVTGYVLVEGVLSADIAITSSTITDGNLVLTINVTNISILEGVEISVTFDGNKAVAE